MSRTTERRGVFMLEFLTKMLHLIAEGRMNEVYNIQNLTRIQSETLRLLNNLHWGEIDILEAKLILNICNIIYNNTDAMCPLEDGVYDKLNELYKACDPEHYQVGGEVVSIDNSDRYAASNADSGIVTPIIFADPSIANGLFYENLSAEPPIDPRLYDRQIDRTAYSKNTRTNLTVPHKYPKLVGTLDKCKFVLIREAMEAGVIDDPSVKIFERDFLGRLFMDGVINQYREYTLLLELKYDGMSVEADVTDHILSARSRGDTNLDEAEDLTPVLKGYPFYNCSPIPDEEAFGMKFEAIITKQNLEKLAALKGKQPYANGRNGIVGLMKSIDAYAYRDLITLVPLETSLDIDPITEVEFMNTYYNSGVYLKYAVVKGNYQQLLFQVYQFVKEAEAIREIMPFMYDGVVVHFVDQDIRQRLGRVNSVNRYSMAIKFNPTVKEAIFLGYTYTVGQNGNITPMIHYTPVEFFGTIHTKSSGHSYQRFKELDLSIGEIINVTYRNDVMPYVSKPFKGAYDESMSTMKEKFPMNCPCCNTPLIFSDTMRTARCPNPKCPDKVMARLTNMVDKLNIKGFSEASLRAMQVISFDDFIHITEDRAVRALGEVNGKKFYAILQDFLKNPIYDYRIIGSLGFTGVAIETWKKILRQVHINDIIGQSPGYLYETLRRIKGIGDNTANIIVNERPDFIEDLLTFTRMPNVVCSYHMSQPKSIRFTGCRDGDLEAYLCSMGYDCNSRASVTKSTDILLVPEIGFSSEKTRKVGEKTRIIPIDEFKKNMKKYL